MVVHNVPFRESAETGGARRSGENTAGLLLVRFLALSFQLCGGIEPHSGKPRRQNPSRTVLAFHNGSVG